MIYSKILTSGDNNNDGDHPETSNTSPPIPPPTQQIPHIVIQNGNGHVSVTTDTNEIIKVLPSKTAKEVVAKERERKARTTLLMALLEDHLAKFHKMADAKEMWEAIKSRFGVNDESKKMRKYLLKQQFEGFYVSTSKGLHKGYDRFQTLLSQLEIHGAGVSHENANHKFLRRRDVGYNGNKTRDNGRRPAYQDDSKALVTIDEEDINWSGQVIQNGNGHVSITTDTNEIIKVLPSKTAKEVVAKERERKARTTLLMALLEDHLAKFHKMADAKEMWEAIKSRFGGNDESKKMRKYLLKQQFEGFYVSTSKGLHKGYDRFQTLLSQLEIHGAGVSHENANHKFLRSLPSSWSQVALIMKTKLGLDTLSFDDLYNNLRAFERDVKGTTASSSNTQNVAFVSTENTSSTNDVRTTYSVSSPSVSKS
nr:ribonuclease H-like domain-containing protein [Tanacetum cinerariifolium]